MIKVCHLTSVHKSHDVRIFQKECTSIATAGYQVTLIAVNCCSEYKNNVNIIGIESAKINNRLIRMLSTTIKVYRKALETKSDIYHIHDPELLPFALKLKKRGAKVIYDAHEDVPLQILSKYWINKHLRRIVSNIFRQYENYAAKNLSFIVAATPSIRNRFLHKNPNTIDINNYPILSEFPTAPQWDIKKNEICYAGGITKERGIGVLIDALELTNNIYLNLAGEYAQKEFRSELRSKKGWRKVNEYGFVKREMVNKLLEKSKIGMATFQPEPNHVESQPNKIFEYMNAGIPVIASNFPLWKRLIEDNNCGVCVNSESAKEIADAIGFLLSNDNAKNMGANGMALVQSKYNWNIEKQKLFTVYNQLCG